MVPQDTRVQLLSGLACTRRGRPHRSRRLVSRYRHSCSFSSAAGALPRASSTVEKAWRCYDREPSIRMYHCLPLALRRCGARVEPISHVRLTPHDDTEHDVLPENESTRSKSLRWDWMRTSRCSADRWHPHGARGRGESSYVVASWNARMGVGAEPSRCAVTKRSQTAASENTRRCGISNCGFQGARSTSARHKDRTRTSPCSCPLMQMPRLKPRSLAWTTRAHASSCTSRRMVSSQAISFRTLRGDHRGSPNGRRRD
jgi:hypothetical protein